MGDVQAQIKVPFYQTNEGRKDIAVLLGLVTEIVNHYTPMMPAGYAFMAGVALRAILNLFGNPDVTMKTIVPMLLAFFLFSAPVSAGTLQLVPFPIAFSDNFVDMGNGTFHQMPAASFGYSWSLADVDKANNNSILKSIGIYYEGALSDGVNPGDKVLLWSDGGVIASINGLGLKAGPQISGNKLGDGWFFGFTWLVPIPAFLNNLGINL